MFPRAAWICLLSMAPLFGAGTSVDEVIHLRRIGEYWKDKDFKTVKNQITSFLTQYPESEKKDALYAMLGDLYFFDNAYEQAAENYRMVQSIDYREKVFHNQLYSLFELKNYGGVIRTAANYFRVSKAVNQEQRLSIKLFFAESLFREAKNFTNDQKRAKFYSKAKHHYEKLLNTKHHLIALYPLAEIHRTLKEYDKAIPYYLQLAEKYPSEREDLYFQVALSQMQFDPDAAIESFAKIEGKHAGIATYHQMALLFQAKKYDAVLAVDTDRQKAIPEEKLSLASFFMGRSHFILKNYPQAASFLRKCLSMERNDSEETKTALLSLILCAKELKDLTLLGKSIDHFHKTFPNDAQYPKIRLFHAQLAMEKTKYDLAMADLKELLQNYPSIDFRDKVLYNIALILSRTEKWDHSRALFLTYLKEYPEGSEKRSAWRHVANCSLQQFKLSPTDATKKAFAADVKGLLDQEEALTAKESQEYRFLLVKVLYDLGEYQDAHAQLSTYLVEYPDHSTASEAAFLNMLCEAELSTDPLSYIEKAENALALNPSFEGRHVLHLKLFNAYLSQSENDQAAAHLYECLSSGYGEMKRENQIWLGDYYYKEVKNNPSNTQAGERALKVYEQLCTSIDLALEAEVLKYVELLTDSEKKIALLQQLIETQEKHPAEPWKFQRLALFQMAEAYEAANNGDKALETYEFLITSSAYAPSYLSKAALLQKARLQYARLRNDQKTESDPIMREILDTLKDLQAMKKSATEPLHIQAAIEYAKIKAELAHPSTRPTVALHFLNRIKEDFTSSDYLTSFAACEEKKPLFESYLQQVEADICQLKELIAEQEAPSINEPDLAEAAEGGTANVAATEIPQEIMQGAESPIEGQTVDLHE